MSRGKCMEAFVLASNQDRLLSRVVVDLIGARGKHLVANTEVERNLERRCLGMCAGCAHRDQGRRKECEYRNAFHGGSPFQGISRLPSPRMKPLVVRRVKGTGRESSVKR